MGSRTIGLWKIVGDGDFFSPFYVEANSFRDAAAKASDILAGSNQVEVAGCRRFYGTVETHIISITKAELERTFEGLLFHLE